MTSQPTVSQHVTPNSIPSQPTSVVDNTSGAGSSTTKPSIMKRGSSVDDESWMYDHVSTLLALVAIVQSILASFALYMRGERAWYMRRECQKNLGYWYRILLYTNGYYCMPGTCTTSVYQALSSRIYGLGTRLTGSLK